MECCAQRRTRMPPRPESGLPATTLEVGDKGTLGRPEACCGCLPWSPQASTCALDCGWVHRYGICPLSLPVFAREEPRRSMRISCTQKVDVAVGCRSVSMELQTTAGSSLAAPCMGPDFWWRLAGLLFEDAACHLFM